MRHQTAGLDDVGHAIHHRRPASAGVLRGRAAERRTQRVRRGGRCHRGIARGRRGRRCRARRPRGENRTRPSTPTVARPVTALQRISVSELARFLKIWPVSPRCSLVVASARRVSLKGEPWPTQQTTTRSFRRPKQPTQPFTRARSARSRSVLQRSNADTAART